MILTIADTGTGMTAVTQQKLFEAFYTMKGIGGTGLGLWISREIIDRHHGGVSVHSSDRPKRSGSVFRLFLPAATYPSVVADTGVAMSVDAAATT